MPFARALLVVSTLMPYVAEGQSTNGPTAGTAFAVAYVETRADAADAGSAALARYRLAVEQQPGCLAAELFAQTDRPGHFAVVEAWRDQAAFDGRDAAAKRELMESLAPIRVSGNLRFDVLQHAMRGNHFTVVEQWRNQEALDAHVATMHARAYRDALQPLTGSPLDERVYASIAR